MDPFDSPTSRRLLGLLRPLFISREVVQMSRPFDILIAGQGRVDRVIDRASAGYAAPHDDARPRTYVFPSSVRLYPSSDLEAALSSGDRHRPFAPFSGIDAVRGGACGKCGRPARTRRQTPSDARGVQQPGTSRRLEWVTC